jgi:hypothetical protein
MPNELTYTATVDEKGEMKIINRNGFNQDVKSYFTGKKVLLKVKQYRKSRSNNQNSYYWGCCIPSIIGGMVDIGYPSHELNSEVVHELLKGKFLKKDLVSEQTGDVLQVTGRTKDLNTVDFMNYVDDIVRWAVEFLSISIPLPGEQAEIDY